MQHLSFAYETYQNDESQVLDCMSTFQAEWLPFRIYLTRLFIVT